MPKGIYNRIKPRPPCSEETKRKISIANTGKKRTPKQIQNIKKGLPKNRKISKEHKQKISDSLKNKRSRGWKGGITYFSGYKLIYMPHHPSADHHGYIREHRIIMEIQIGRYLKPKEVVHHINKNPSDNRIENLMLLKNCGFHTSIHKYNKCNPFGILFNGRAIKACD